MPHFGLVIESFEHNGSAWLLVAYGTSRNDKALESKHPVILDVRPETALFLEMESVTHFLCDRLAILPWNPIWFKQDLRGLLSKANKTPAEKQFLADLDKAHKAMDKNAQIALRLWLKNERPGLLTGLELR